MANKLSLIGLTVSGFFNDLMGGILGKTKALRNLGLPAFVWTPFQSIANQDLMNPEGQGYRLNAKDLYSIRNIRSNLQAQVDVFLGLIDSIKNILSSVFPNTTAKSTVGLIWPSNGSTEDLRLSVKKLYIYNPTNGALLPGRVEVPITITPTSATECKLDYGRDNGNSPYVFIGGQNVPVVETSSAQTIYDFDMLTIEWNEGTAQNPIIKRRTDMAIAGPFFDSDGDYGEFPTTEVGSGVRNYVFDLCRGSGDDFQGLINQGAQNVPVTLIKKQPREFIVAISFTIPSSNILSVSRTGNISKIKLKTGSSFPYWLGRPNDIDFPITDISDNRILQNQPIIVRATGALSDFSGAFNILSVNKTENSITYYNYSPGNSSVPEISNPEVEVSVEPFFSQPLQKGEAVSVSIIRAGNNSVVDHYTDFIVGDNYNVSGRKGYYLYGKPNVAYNIMYGFEPQSANPSWGYRQACILSNFANSEIKGTGRNFTARQFIRGFSTLKSPSFSQGKILSTSKKSFWNRTTAKTPGSILGLSFPGEVEINGNLEIKQQIDFGTGALLTEYPASLTGGSSSVSPFYEYFNKQKDITHLFQLQVGGEICYIPAVSLEEQVFKYEQIMVSRKAVLTQTAMVSLDKFYNAGNGFVFQRGGSFKSSANHTNIFFGELFQPLVRSATQYNGSYENTMPYRSAWKAYNPLKPNKTESVTPSLNQYYEAFSSEDFSTSNNENYFQSPRTQWRTFYNSLGASQLNPTTNETTTTHFPTNAGTLIFIFGFRSDWAETQPEGLTDMVPQSVIGQGVDWDVLEHSPTAGGSKEYHVDNGLGWLLYTNGYDLTNKSIYFTNPGPYTHLTNISQYRPSVGAIPERLLDYDKKIALTKKFSPNLFYFLAMTFETRVDGQIISEEVMNTNYTALPVASGYPNSGTAYSFLPTTAFLNGITPTTVKFFVGSGPSSLVNITPGGQADLKIIRSTLRTPSYLNRFGRKLSVGISEASTSGLVNGWWRGFSGSYFPFGVETYRTCCPMNLAFVGAIDDVLSDTQLATMYSIFRNGVFKDLSWGFPQDS